MSPIEDILNFDVKLYFEKYLGAPKIVKSSPSMLEVAEGGTVTLECAASGNPPPLIKWTKISGGGVMPDGTRDMVSETVTISGVTRSHAGMYR